MSKVQVLKNGKKVEVTDVENSFCPTGKGGGVDPTCGKGGASGSGSGGKPRNLAAQKKIARISKVAESVLSDGKPRAVDLSQAYSSLELDGVIRKTKQGLSGELRSSSGFGNLGSGPRSRGVVEGKTVSEVAEKLYDLSLSVSSPRSGD